jgi:hypothetical protein
MKMQPRSILIKLVLLRLAAVGPNVQALVPAPDGGYPGGNTAEGQAALLSLTTGIYNTAVGLFSLRTLTDGSFNTATGAGTLLANTADENTATGAGALLSNATGDANTANGAFALFSNTTGVSNTAIGERALLSNTVGANNTASGAFALFSNTTGTQNTANGIAALEGNTTGNGNTADGIFALANNITGEANTAIGFNACSGVTTANNVICVRAAGANVSNTTWIGNIYQTTTVSGTTLPVVVSDSGQLGTAPSSRQFKKEIKPMDQASESILALKPVTFHYKNDATGTPQFGLVAEEVAEVNPDLVVRDEKSEIYTVRYDAINAMLLNEFLKEHRAFVQEQRNVEEQQKEIDVLKAELKEQRSLIQKVSDKLELKRSAPQAVVNDQ